MLIACWILKVLVFFFFHHVFIAILALHVCFCQISAPVILLSLAFTIVKAVTNVPAWGIPAAPSAATPALLRRYSAVYCAYSAYLHLTPALHLDLVLWMAYSVHF